MKPYDNLSIQWLQRFLPDHILLRVRQDVRPSKEFAGLTLATWVSVLVGTRVYGESEEYASFNWRCNLDRPDRNEPMQYGRFSLDIDEGELHAIIHHDLGWRIAPEWYGTTPIVISQSVARSEGHEEWFDLPVTHPCLYHAFGGFQTALNAFIGSSRNIGVPDEPRTILAEVLLHRFSAVVCAQLNRPGRNMGWFQRGYPTNR